MKKIISFALIFCLVLAFAAFLCSGRSESNTAYAAGSNDEIIGTWYNAEDGEAFQFRKDGRLIFYSEDDYEIEIVSYIYDAENDSLTVNGQNVDCYLCGNGLIIGSDSFYTLYTRL